MTTANAVLPVPPESDPSSVSSRTSKKRKHGDEDGLANDEHSPPTDSSNLKALRSVRQGGFRCLNLLFLNCPSFQWGPYLPVLFAELIAPRLPDFARENSQSISGLLQLFSTWANSRHTVLLLGTDPNLLRNVAETLVQRNGVVAKDEVVIFILALLRKIVALAMPSEVPLEESPAIPEASSEKVRQELLLPNIELFLAQTHSILRKNPSKEVLEQCVEIVALLAPFISDAPSSTDTTTLLVDISVFLLNQPPGRVPPRTKSELLKILLGFLPSCTMQKGDDLFEKTFKTVSSLFGYFKDRESREMLADVLAVFSQRDSELEEVAELSQKLNAWSKKRLDEPDFDARLEAFGTINEHRFTHFSSRQWLPLLYNMLFHVRDHEELAIRTNAAYALRRFVEVCKPEDDSNLDSILLPALRVGMREQSEIIRLEYLGVLAHAIKHCSRADLDDMKPLLMGDDEEANFFNNVLHIQQHRRMRALRRLASDYGLRSENIAQIFLPLLEHFVFDQAEDPTAHNLAHEAIRSIGKLSEQLAWGQYRALLTRYLGLVETKKGTKSEKILIRLLEGVVDSLARASGHHAGQKNVEDEEVEADAEDVAMEDSTKPTELSVVQPEKISTRLSETLPSAEKLEDAILKSFLPTLAAYLHVQDDATVSLRVPVAVALVKLLKLLPDDKLRIKLPGILTDVSHILRSRAQDSRDMARKTLAEITGILGPNYFSFVLKELRGALQRGYQLHVLSYTVHHILVMSSFSPGELDYCASAIVTVIMDDIFGVVGQEKDAEGYISKMKEVKSSKSYDSMEILSTITTLSNLIKLIRPIRLLLLENLNLKQVKKIDELLRRITVGLLRNDAVNDQKSLVFCYEVIQEVYKSETATPKEKELDEKTQRYMVNLKVPSKNPMEIHTTAHLYKLARFSLDILRTILNKHDALRTPANIAGFIPVIGDAVLSRHEDVQQAALRVLTVIVRVPLSDIDHSAGLFVRKAVDFIKSCPTLNAELAQASLKLLAAILKDRPSVPVKEDTVAYVLIRIKPDLEEPDRQGIIFTFLRSVLERRVVIPEVYEILDEVAKIMVTNQTKQVRDLARRTYFQFVMEYPQSERRWQQQLAFLVKNLEYPHMSGRQSVLETCHLLITKVTENLMQTVLQTFFVPLVLLLVNDDSAECREMAGLLLKDILKRANAGSSETFLGLLRRWLDMEQTTLVRVSLQVFGLHLDVAGAAAEKEAQYLSTRVLTIIQSHLESDGSEDVEGESDTEWELMYFALQIWVRICQAFPSIAFSKSSTSMWAAVRRCLSYPHGWIKLTSARLLGLLFAEFSRAESLSAPEEKENGARAVTKTDAVIGKKDLVQLSDVEMTELARRISGQLANPEITEEIGLQAVKNLVFLARWFCKRGTFMPQKSLPTEEDGGEGEDDEEEKEEQSALAWVFGRLCGIIRSDHYRKSMLLLPRKFSLQCIHALISILASESLPPLHSVFLTLYNLLETPLPTASTSTATTVLKEHQTIAQEVLNALQKKIGTTEYAAAYNAAKEEVKNRRAERRGKRKRYAVAEPEKAAKRNERRKESKKEAKKRKVGEWKEYRRGVAS